MGCWRPWLSSSCPKDYPWHRKLAEDQLLAMFSIALFFFFFLIQVCCCCRCQVASVVSDSVRPHRRKPTRLLRPWDSPGKNTGVGCHLLLQCMKVKSESEVAQSCPTLSDPMDCSPPGPSVHGIHTYIHSDLIHSSSIQHYPL